MSAPSYSAALASSEITLTPGQAKFIADCIMVGADGATALTTNKDAANDFALLLMAGEIGERIDVHTSHTNEEEE